MFTTLSTSTRSSFAGPRAATVFLCLAQAALAATESDDPEDVKPGDKVDGTGWGKAFAVIFITIGVCTSLALLWSHLFRPPLEPRPVLPIHNGEASLDDKQAPTPVENETKQSWDGDLSQPPPIVTSLSNEDVRPPPPYPWELSLYHSRGSSDNGYPDASQGAPQPGAFVGPASLPAPPLAHTKNNSPRFRSY
ncbi:hypothetical protein C8Q74DRAFT_1373027 [Fomes fomentarius]|nr:hypothetical protein C8Q74DRAFT_1373027 [Fomes fomentarius]